MTKKKNKVWISATISKDMYDVVRQKAFDLYGGNFSKGLEHIISVYQSVWTDLMMKILITEIYNAAEKIKEQKQLNQ